MILPERNELKKDFQGEFRGYISNPGLTSWKKKLIIYIISHQQKISKDIVSRKIQIHSDVTDQDEIKALKFTVKTLQRVQVVSNSFSKQNF